MRQGKLRRKAVVNIEKLYYPSFLSNNVQTLRIGEANPDPYFLDKKVQYIVLEPIETGVLTT